PATDVPPNFITTMSDSIRNSRSAFIERLSIVARFPPPACLSRPGATLPPPCTGGARDLPPAGGEPFRDVVEELPPALLGPLVLRRRHRPALFQEYLGPLAFE